MIIDVKKNLIIKTMLNIVIIDDENSDYHNVVG
jgi:hypothetical protein